MTRSPPQRRPETEQLRESICNAAIRLFAQNGFRGTSVQQIADAVGISIGLVGVGSRWAVIADIANTVHIAIRLTDVGDEQAVVDAVGHAESTVVVSMYTQPCIELTLGHSSDACDFIRETSTVGVA